MKEKPAYINDPDALVTATYEGEHELVKELLAKGADINVTNDSGETSVIVAAEFGYVYIIEILIAHGANINVKDNDGDTALDIARYHSNNDTIKLLLSARAEGTSGPSAKERMMDEYYDACDNANIVKRIDKLIKK